MVREPFSNSVMGWAAADMRAVNCVAVSRRERVLD